MTPGYQTFNHLNSKPFNERTFLDHLSTKLDRYSDPHCIQVMYFGTIIDWSAFQIMAWIVDIIEHLNSDLLSAIQITNWVVDRNVYHSDAT